MSGWSDIFLGIIAVSNLATSIVLIALLVAAVRVARRVEALTRQIERDLKPALLQLSDMSAQLARAASLAAVQVERVDRLMTDLTAGVEQTVSVVQGIVGGPLAKGGKLVAALSAARAVLGVLRGFRNRRSDDEDPLFV
ncbi:MAG TPA: hypothetical protein VJP86_03035 [Vicinamibacterales bacterium]|nr:hypothetical protein [Vicinamibacterales bacterium]